jgi:hypothetical protein
VFDATLLRAIELSAEATLPNLWGDRMASMSSMVRPESSGENLVREGGRNIPTPRGGDVWNAMTVMRVMKRLGIAG